MSPICFYSSSVILALLSLINVFEILALSCFVGFPMTGWQVVSSVSNYRIFFSAVGLTQHRDRFTLFCGKEDSLEESPSRRRCNWYNLNKGRKTNRNKETQEVTCALSLQLCRTGIGLTLVDGFFGFLWTSFYQYNILSRIRFIQLIDVDQAHSYWHLAVSLSSLMTIPKLTGGVE